jgi:hypothetical protein
MYSIAIHGGIDRKSNSAFLNDSPITRTNYLCSGVVHCQYLHEDIKEMDHSEVTDTMLNTLRQIRETNGCDSQEADVNRLVIHS